MDGSVLGGRKAQNVLQALDIDGGDRLASKKVHPQVLDLAQSLVALPDVAAEQHHGLHSDLWLLGREAGEGAVGVRRDTKLVHVEDTVVKGAGDGEVLGALLGVRGEGDQGGVVLVREELERGGILEGCHGVLLGEPDRVGLLERVEVGQDRLHDLGGAGAAEEESGLGVLDELGEAVVGGALGAGILGLSVEDGGS